MFPAVAAHKMLCSDKKTAYFSSKSFFQPLLVTKTYAIMTLIDKKGSDRMVATACNIDSLSVQKLLSTGNGDAALLYLYIQSGNDPAKAQQTLCFTASRYQCAAATLRQLGLWEEEKIRFIPTGERPQYSEEDVKSAIGKDDEFAGLYGEIQRLLGRTLNTEELKIILGFVRYLGLPGDVICVLVCYCKDRARQRGSLRNPSLRTIEKEAYSWAEQGIDTMEAAAAFIQNQNQRHSRQREIMDVLQIRGRELTAAESKYAQSWMEMGFEKDAIAMAYERTCLNTGGLNWPYMNKIMNRWHEAGLHTVEQIRSGDAKKGKGNAPRQLDADELAAIERMMQEG